MIAFSYDIPFYLRWTVDELKDMIALLKRADFDPTVIDTDLHKKVADAIQDLTNNKDVFLCILRFHTRVGFLRHYERLLSELEGLPDAPGDKYAADSQVLCDRTTVTLMWLARLESATPRYLPCSTATRCLFGFR